MTHDASSHSFTYNGLDTRVSKVDSGGTKTYLREGAYVTDPLVSDGAAVYTPGLSERRSGVSTFYHAGFKNAEAQSGGAQSVTATKTFDAFGLPDTSSGTWQGPFGYGGPFGYQSDPGSGLMLLGHRYCDASTGRFLTRDPAKDGRNWYAYCDGNPANRVDATGRTSWIVLLLRRGIEAGAHLLRFVGAAGAFFTSFFSSSPVYDGGTTPVFSKGHPPIEAGGGSAGNHEPPYRPPLDQGAPERGGRGGGGGSGSGGGRGVPSPVKPGTPPGGGGIPSGMLRAPLVFLLPLLPSNCNASGCYDMVHQPGYCPTCGRYFPS